MKIHEKRELLARMLQAIGILPVPSWSYRLGTDDSDLMADPEWLSDLRGTIAGKIAELEREIAAHPVSRLTAQIQNIHGKALDMVPVAGEAGAQYRVFTEYQAANAEIIGSGPARLFSSTGELLMLIHLDSRPRYMVSGDRLQVGFDVPFDAVREHLVTD